MAAAVVAAGADSASSGPGQPVADAANASDRSGPVRWRLAPVRLEGGIGLEKRYSRDEDGLRSERGLFAAGVDAASYIWEPWFIQLRAGLGLILSQGKEEQPLAPTREDDTSSWVGRLGLQVFPASRFPFELRGEVTDSRSNGDFVGTDYRAQRFSVSQSYRPENSAANYNVSYETNTLSTQGRPDDTVSVVRGLMVNTFGLQTIELSGSETQNDRGGRSDSSKITSLAGRHTYRQNGVFLADNLATFNDIRVRNQAADIDLMTNITQLSSFVTWRPQVGNALYSESHPMYLTGSVRVAESEVASNVSAGTRQSADGALGINYDVSRNWRIGGGINLGKQKVQTDGLSVTDGETTLTSQTAIVSYTPDMLGFGAWRWGPTLSLGASAVQSSAEGDRHTETGQLGHTLSRSWLGEQQSALMLNFSQTFGVSLDSTVPDTTQTLTNSISLYRQFANGGGTQAYAGLSYSDSRSWGPVQGVFQIANAQFTRRGQLSRQSSWSGSLTAQVNRIQIEQTNPFLTSRSVSDSGWNSYYSIGLTYEHYQVFGVRNLRFVALANGDSQVFESRAQGDLNAPSERINHLLEARLEYPIGRLETRLVARSSQVEERRIDSIFFRINRRFGNY
ncbi:MAG: hypothetical protein MUC86_16360 [Burkholderiaceae bacterium]|jgi:hypothetical protein|nr:hypothetical protein [Burkholderiaceae bacterium]